MDGIVSGIRMGLITNGSTFRRKISVEGSYRKDLTGVMVNSIQLKESFVWYFSLNVSPSNNPLIRVLSVKTSSLFLSYSPSSSTCRYINIVSDIAWTPFWRSNRPISLNKTQLRSFDPIVTYVRREFPLSGRLTGFGCKVRWPFTTP